MIWDLAWGNFLGPSRALAREYLSDILSFGSLDEVHHPPDLRVLLEEGLELTRVHFLLQHDLSLNSAHIPLWKIFRVEQNGIEIAPEDILLNQSPVAHDLSRSLSGKSGGDR